MKRKASIDMEVNKLLFFIVAFSYIYMRVLKKLFL